MNPTDAYNFSSLYLQPSIADKKVDKNIDINNNDENVEEKLKVDRKKFEALLEGKGKTFCSCNFLHIHIVLIDPDNGSAEKFFGDIKCMFPSVDITWPQKLKAGTKSKKDPHVKISGIPSMVKAARIKILESLDPRRDRVTLKMDIDWTAHSHIIGKAGSSIQKVMDSTGCHVHFPDANRTNGNEKSNQVSISGTPSGVKEARIEIRELLPVVIWFNLLIKADYRSTFLDPLNRVIQFVERMTGIQITVRFNATTHQSLESNAITFIIKGVYGKRNLINLGIDLFLSFMTDVFIKEEMIYQLNTEISVNHHNSVTGVDQSNLRSIMRTTGTVITFPDQKENITNDTILSRLSLLNQSSSPSSRKTTVNIKGPVVNGVLMALHLIELHIPLSLTFDLKEGQDVNSQTIEMLSNIWNVFISVKPKPKQNSKTVWIKSAEKDEWKLFEVRRHLVEEQEVTNRDTPIDRLWLNIDDKIESSIWRWTDDSITSTNTESVDSSDGFNNWFERAPGAERNAKLNCF